MQHNWLGPSSCALYYYTVRVQHVKLFINTGLSSQSRNLYKKITISHYNMAADVRIQLSKDHIILAKILQV